MSAKIKLMLADDHQIVRMGLATIIRLEKDLVLVGEARNGHEAVKLAMELQPDVILMDIMMPKLNGAAATRRILESHPSTPRIPRILILTTFGESAEVREALEAGASGALIKDTPREKLVAAIRETAAGKRVLSPEIAHALEIQSNKPTLSNRQLEILGYVAKGLTTKDIASLIGIGQDGVNAHLRTIFERLGAASRAEAVSLAISGKLLKI